MCTRFQAATRSSTAVSKAGWPCCAHHQPIQDLGHPLCGHLRDGTWALDYVHTETAQQVDVLPHLAEPAKWLSQRFDLIRDTAPNFMRPKYFALVIKAAYTMLRFARLFRACRRSSRMVTIS